MKRIKYISAALLCLMLLTLLSGCRLALEANDAQPDRFVGFSIRLEDPFADDIDRSVPHEIDGQPLIIFIAEENGETYVSSDSGEWLSDVHMHVKSSDEGEEHLLSGTLNICDHKIPSGFILSAEHVYQRPDGSLYAVNGGSSYSGHLSGLEIKVNEESKITDYAGKTVSALCEVTLTVASCGELLSARLVEMNDSNTPIADHPVGEPEEIQISSAAHWVLLEETLSDGSLRRSALNAPLDGQTFELLIPDQSGVAVPHSYTLLQN